jgi:hypothetical protein
MAFFALNIRAQIGPATETQNLQLRVPLGGFAAFVPAWWQEKLIQAALPLALGLWTYWRTTNSPWRRDTAPSNELVHG